MKRNDEKSKSCDGGEESKRSESGSVVEREKEKGREVYLLETG